MFFNFKKYIRIEARPLSGFPLEESATQKDNCGHILYNGAACGLPKNEKALQPHPKGRSNDLWYATRSSATSSSSPLLPLAAALQGDFSRFGQ